MAAADSREPSIDELIPCPDPWEVARRLAHLPHLLFLDSSEPSADRGRYSYVMADPTDWQYEEINSSTREDPRYGLVDCFDRLAIEMRETSPPVPDLPPFQGGYAGLFGYDLNRELERIPVQPGNDLPVPILGVGRYPWVVSWDLLRGRAWLVCSPQTDNDTRRRVRNQLAVTATVVPRTSQSSRVVGPIRRHPVPGLTDAASNFSRAGYVSAVRRVIDYIHAGDVFQVNLSQRLVAPLTTSPLDLYGRLRRRSSSPYGCYFDLGDLQILSSSPEQFLSVKDGDVVTRPIKGTRPRGATPAEDAAHLQDLVTAPKDRAENVMIVDLLRNDLGRVCEYGSVRVSKVCEVESYNYVHHLVSEVRGRLRAGLSPADLLRAAFPGGSVTGAPKVRAMEIIAELEPTARGAYCGCVGYLGFNGTMDTNILIRTFTAGGGWLQFPVGGGIVADSDPVREYEETLHKAAGLLRALPP